MLNTLYLTEAEAQQFATLSSSVQEGWIVESQEITYEDTAERFKLRLSFLKVHDPKLLAFKEQLEKCETKEQAIALLETMDLSDIKQPELAQLFFTLGPDAVTNLIGMMLAVAASDDEIQRVAALSMVRKELLRSLTTHFSS